MKTSRTLVHKPETEIPLLIRKR